MPYEQIKALHRAEADIAVITCGAYTRARDLNERRNELRRINDAIALAHRLGLKCAVAGRLDLNLVEELAEIPYLHEIQVGHACIALAVLRGIEQSVADFRRALDRGLRRAFNV